MLIEKRIKNIKSNLIKKNSDKYEINEKILDIYIKENINLNICKFLNLKYINMNILNKMYPYISERFFSYNLSVIINNNDLNSKEITDFLIEKASNKNDKFININEIFASTFSLKINGVKQFEEEDLKKIIDFTKNNVDYKNKPLKNEKIFKTQKNLNFLLKDKELFNDKQIIDSILLNPFLSGDFLENFLDLHKDNFNQINSFNLVVCSPITEKIIDKYKSYIEPEYLHLNNTITDENILSKYVIKTKDAFKLKNNKVSKDFLKENINVVSYDLIFNNINDEKEYEYFIDLLLKKEDKKEEDKKYLLSNILSFLSSSKKIDYDFYNKMFKKYQIENNLSKKILYFNEITDKKHFHIIDEFLTKCSVTDEPLKEYIFKVIRHIIKYVDLTEDIIIKHLDTLKINDESQKNFDYLFKHQKLPNKIINNKEFIKKEIINEELYELFLSNQISNQKELKNLNNNIPESLKNNINLKEKEIFLLNNIDYLKNTTNQEKLELIKKYKNNNLKSLHLIFLLMENNERKIKLIPKTDYGISLF